MDFSTSASRSTSSSGGSDDRARLVEDAREAGVVGYLNKLHAPADLVPALLAAGVGPVRAAARNRDVLAAQPWEGVELVEADALKVKEADLVSGPTHLVSNLPYNVGTPLLIKWLTGPWLPHSLTHCLQPTTPDCHAPVTMIRATAASTVLQRAFLCRNGITPSSACTR